MQYLNARETNVPPCASLIRSTQMGRVLSRYLPYSIPILLSSRQKSFENYRLREPTNLSFVEEQKSRKVIYTNVDTSSENRTDNFLSSDRLFIWSLIKYILYDGTSMSWNETFLSSSRKHLSFSSFGHIYVHFFYFSLHQIIKEFINFPSRI